MYHLFVLVNHGGATSALSDAVNRAGMSCQIGVELEQLDVNGAEPPDAVLLDITMPDMNGIETLGKILEIDPAAKVIMVTAVAQQSEVVKALKGGAMDYVIKPFDAQRLGAALDGAILEKDKLC